MTKRTPAPVQPQPLRISDLVERRPGRLNADPLQDVIGSEILIRATEFADVNGIPVVVIETVDGKRYYTFSRVIIDMLKSEKVQEALKSGTPIAARVERRKRYLILT